MNRNMTPRAFSTGLKSEPAVRRLAQIVETGMALQTQLPPFASHEQHTIRGAMRTMTRGATFHLCRRMFVDIWAALLNVALNTSFRLSLHQT
jgi:hypothetical protein